MIVKWKGQYSRQFTHMKTRQCEDIRGMETVTFATKVSDVCIGHDHPFMYMPNLFLWERAC